MKTTMTQFAIDGKAIHISSEKDAQAFLNMVKPEIRTRIERTQVNVEITCPFEGCTIEAKQTAMGFLIRYIKPGFSTPADSLNPASAWKKGYLKVI